MAEPFLGQVVLFAGNFAPYGWALCNGSILPIQQYAALFSLLGVSYGGNGTSNFALPDLQGRAPISFGQPPGLSTYDIGEDGGTENVSILSTQMPAHTHGATINNAAGDGYSPLNSFWATDGSGNGQPAYTAPPVNTNLNALSLGTAGGNLPHENRPPFLTINYIIALQGSFPARP